MPCKRKEKSIRKKNKEGIPGHRYHGNLGRQQKADTPFK